MTDESMEVENNTQTAIAIGLALADNDATVDGTPIRVLPAGYEVHDLGHLLSVPARTKGTVTLFTADSFIAYVNATNPHAHNATRIYADSKLPRLVAVFNDHGERAGWQDHRAVFAGQHSPEWQAWVGKNGVHMKQAEFAEFIETNLPDIVAPPAADMLEISRSLEAKKSVKFASGVRLSNGENQLTYEETVSGSAGKGKLQIPETFSIGIPVILGGRNYRVDARLRYRIADGGTLTIWYDMIRPYKIIEDALAQLHEQIEAETKIKPLIGGC